MTDLSQALKKDFFTFFKSNNLMTAGATNIKPDLELALVLPHFHFAPSEVEPGPATQGWRDPLLTALYHLLLNTSKVTQTPAERRTKEEYCTTQYHTVVRTTFCFSAKISCSWLLNFHSSDSSYRRAAYWIGLCFLAPFFFKLSAFLSFSQAHYILYSVLQALFCDNYLYLLSKPQQSFNKTNIIKMKPCSCPKSAQCTLEKLLQKALLNYE